MYYVDRRRNSCMFKVNRNIFQGTPNVNRNMNRCIPSVHITINQCITMNFNVKFHSHKMQEGNKEITVIFMDKKVLPRFELESKLRVLTISPYTPVTYCIRM